MINTPVLVIGFNRPLLIEKLLIDLKKIGVVNLYVSLDGPRNRDDLSNCAKTYETVKKFKDFFNLNLIQRNENLGCCLGMISAIDWFFAFNEFGVIIEDDCFIDHEFFELIDDEKFEGVFSLNQKMRIFTAHNPFDFKFTNNTSRSTLIHGWATYAEAWNVVRKDYFKINLPSWTNSKKLKRPLSVALYWWANSTRAKLGLVDTWDGIFADNCWRHGIYTILPRRNLVTNLGFGPSATHTKNPEQKNTVSVPKLLLQSQSLDYLLDRYYFQISKRHFFKSVMRVAVDLIRLRKKPRFEQTLRQDASKRTLDFP